MIETVPATTIRYLTDGVPFMTWDDRRDMIEYYLNGHAEIHVWEDVCHYGSLLLRILIDAGYLEIQVLRTLPSSFISETLGCIRNTRTGLVVSGLPGYGGTNLPEDE